MNSHARQARNVSFFIAAEIAETAVALAVALKDSFSFFSGITPSLLVEIRNLTRRAAG